MHQILFIIGNGFDRHHKLKTGYLDYYLFLEKNCPEVLRDIGLSKFFNGAYCSAAPEEGDIFWSELEKNLEYDYEEHFEETVFAYAPDLMAENPDFGAVINRIEDGVSPFFKFTGEFLVKWIKSVDVSRCKRDDGLCLPSNAFYLNFNYTSTLQTIYSIADNQVLHIHGSLQEVLKNEGILQFGNPTVSAERLQSRLENKYAEHACGGWVMDAIPAMIDLCKALTKNLKQNYERLKNFLQFKQFDKVVVLGHSFMGVDKPYYDDVLVPFLKDCSWKFYCHDKDDWKYLSEFKQEHPSLLVDCEKW